MAVCQYHPDRPGIGICVRCRAPICSACCTRLDGINHCHACLKKLGRRTERQQGPALAILGGLGSLVLAWLLFAFLFWEFHGALAP
ncbi:MAG TPA: hypothetical protein VFA18_14810 [Gemmataceae bacterium]|nr:hypothetical protein [Gemmataceae bacterium]